MLNKKGLQRIHDAIDRLFDKLKSIYLGNSWVPSKGAPTQIVVTSNPTLGSLYQESVRAGGAEPQPDTEHAISHIADGYIEASREKAKAQVAFAVDSALRQEQDPEEVLKGQLSETFSRITTDVDRIVDSQAQNARSVGALEGIEAINRHMGIDDPVVFFIIVRDGHICSECLRLHQLSGTISGPPRLWYLSEVGSGYHKRGQQNPKVSGLHIHCRCSQATLAPGYGFDSAGMVTYIGPEHDEMKKQRG